jgi:hypothetical protein
MGGGRWPYGGMSSRAAAFRRFGTASELDERIEEFGREAIVDSATLVSVLHPSCGAAGRAVI